MKPRKLQRMLLKLELRKLERISSDASATLEAIRDRQAGLAKLFAYQLAGDHDQPSINAICREVRSTISEEDQTSAKLYTTLRARLAIENTLWPVKPY